MKRTLLNPISLLSLAKDLTNTHFYQKEIRIQQPQDLTFMGMEYTIKLFFSLSLIFFISPQLSSNPVSSTKPPSVVGDKKNSDLEYKKFQVKLAIEHGHIGHVYIGCQKDASDGFDSRIDDLAPPPGMGGVGYTFLVSPDRAYNLYRDIRGFSDNVQWVFYAKPGKSPVKVTWDPNSIPLGWNMFCGPWDGKSELVTVTYDCRKTNSVETDKTGFFRFWIESQNIAKSE